MSEKRIQIGRYYLSTLINLSQSINVRSLSPSEAVTCYSCLSEREVPFKEVILEEGNLSRFYLHEDCFSNIDKRIHQVRHRV